MRAGVALRTLCLSFAMRSCARWLGGLGGSREEGHADDMTWWDEGTGDWGWGGDCAMMREWISRTGQGKRISIVCGW